MSSKKMLGLDVLTASRQRIAWVFDNFSRIYVSFSGGKDSSVMLHLVMAEAIKRDRKVGILFVDLEGQYKLTIDHIKECQDSYKSHSDFYWVALPLILRNAVSVYEPRWVCWDPEKRLDWIREPPSDAITQGTYFPFFKPGMEFEEFVPAFGEWFSQGEDTACFVGIRTAESLNRWRTIKSTTKIMRGGFGWTTQIADRLINCYPIYDWKTEDIWVYNGKEKKFYNRLYDRMYQAGLSIHQQRICQPYGDDQRKGLWLFQVLEPDTWARVVARVNGANQGALYAQERGNILGRIKITRPEGHTWESFAKMLLESLPPILADHYRDKISVFLKWWDKHGVNPIPDEADPKSESGTEGDRKPSWRRICKTLLKNDYWCKGLSFSQTDSGRFEQYKQMMRKRRDTWDTLPTFITTKSNG